MIMTWTVFLTRKAYKQFSKLPAFVQDLADLALVDLRMEGVNPVGWNCLKTGSDEYRIRLNYRYRMQYRLIKKRIVEIEVFYIGHRKDAYR